ncbi:MAG: hypothetical protein ACYCVZ_13035 [Streptosporangiaceae bacterium]
MRNESARSERTASVPAQGHDFAASGIGVAFAFAFAFATASIGDLAGPQSGNLVLAIGQNGPRRARRQGMDVDPDLITGRRAHL